MSRDTVYQQLPGPSRLPQASSSCRGATSPPRPSPQQRHRPHPVPRGASASRGRSHRNAAVEQPDAVRELPNRPGNSKTSTSPPSPASTRSSCGSFDQAPTSPTRPTCCSSALPVSAKPCLPSSWVAPRSTVGTGCTTPPPLDLVARCRKAALEGRWAATMRFFSGPAVLIVDELGYLPMPAEDAASPVPGHLPPLPERINNPDHQPHSAHG